MDLDWFTHWPILIETSLFELQYPRSSICSAERNSRCHERNHFLYTVKTSWKPYTLSDSARTWSSDERHWPILIEASSFELQYPSCFKFNLFCQWWAELTLPWKQSFFAYCQKPLENLHSIDLGDSEGQERGDSMQVSSFTGRFSSRLHHSNYNIPHASICSGERYSRCHERNYFLHTVKNLRKKLTLYVIPRTKNVVSYERCLYYHYN